MLYVFHGNRFASQNKIRDIISSLQKRKEGVQVIKIQEGGEGYALDDIVYAQGLFSQKYIVCIDSMCFMEKAQTMADSSHIFLLYIEKLNAKQLSTYTKHAKTIQEYKTKEIKASNINFNLADALVQKNRKRAWQLFRQVVLEGHSPEEIQGVLAWQLDALHKVMQSTSATASGLKPFVYSKLKKYKEKYSLEEVQNKSWECIQINADAHRGEHDYMLRLEKFILS